MPSPVHLKFGVIACDRSPFKVPIRKIKWHHSDALGLVHSGGMAKPFDYEVPRSHFCYLEGSFPRNKLPPDGAPGWFIHIDENILAHLVITDFESLGGLLATALMQGEFLIRQDLFGQIQTEKSAREFRGLIIIAIEVPIQR